jgi:hypothetical protein
VLTGTVTIDPQADLQDVIDAEQEREIHSTARSDPRT